MKKDITSKQMEMAFKVCMRILKNEEYAKDCMQETAYKYLYKSKFRGESSVETYIYRIAYNVAIDMLKKSNETFELYDNVAIHKDNADNILRKVVVEEALDKLPDRQKQIVIMRFYEGYPLKDIAERLNISLGGAKSNLFVALKNLKQILEDKNEM